jgi:hypothetical protein
MVLRSQWNAATNHPDPAADVQLVHVRHQSVSAHKVGLTVLEQFISIPEWLARFQNGNALR